ncbi:MAG: membrane dipeptidase [Acidaminobacter sp.]|uniref:dipeptidase n=1 Tax=Acidaminobacter sp. TaxID=1872102 RepID=UPI00137F456B|nr:membrane dipeptidase [Acidaminobacter sp.]MZQ98250.1 membrane dipeptidase [Acidaminobacter sp.]
MTFIFDAHADIWSDVVVRRSRGEREVFRNRHLEKFKKGGVSGGIFVMWIDPPFDQNPKQRLAEIIKAAQAELEEASGLLHLVRSASDFDAAAALGKMPVVWGVEGLSGIGSDLGGLEALYDLGIRHMSLTWNEANPLATGVKQAPDRGLTALGFEAVRQIEALGILLDVSHLNEKSFWEVMSATSKPLIASHSNARALCDAARNLTDEQIRAIASTGGIIGINSYRDFIDLDPAKQTIERFVDHIDYIVSLVGVQHVGLGYDFCDYIEENLIQGSMLDASRSTAPDTLGLETAEKASEVLKHLRERGYKESDIENIAGANFVRLLKDRLEE